MKINPDKLTTSGIRRAARSLRVAAGMLDRVLSRIQFGELSPDQAAAELGEILETEPILMSHYLGTPPDPTPAEIAGELDALITQLESCDSWRQTSERIYDLREYQQSLTETKETP